MKICWHKIVSLFLTPHSQQHDCWEQVPGHHSQWLEPGHWSIKTIWSRENLPHKQDEQRQWLALVTESAWQTSFSSALDTGGCWAHCSCRCYECLNMCKNIAQVWTQSPCCYHAQPWTCCKSIILARYIAMYTFMLLPDTIWYFLSSLNTQQVFHCSTGI